MTFQNNFTPASQVISSISNANPAVVTTATNNDYLTGLQIRMNYPLSFGMNDLIGQIFEITVLTANTFSIPVDTTMLDPFTIASTKQVAQVIPVGEVASTLKMAEINNRNIIPET